ncbi:hypothetical protein B296_00024851 [Ensete ventricosum]|uniref:Transposase (putative) gypsy type domain-containing protein n=1 Tax=Ensete ventricosum TaxID=4639 RepID=A0A426Z8J4_ENSVE|nr:hypothetical protein B296_00024851 [Ensete ventricosum]
MLSPPPPETQIDARRKWRAQAGRIEAFYQEDIDADVGCFNQNDVRHCWFRPLCVSSSAIVSGRSRCSTRWMDPSYPVTEVGCWSGGAREGRRHLRSGRASVPARRSGAGAYIVSVVGHPYLATLLPLWITMSSCPSTTPVVLALLARGGFGLVPSGSSGTDQTEQELKNLNGAGADPTEQELGNSNGARADPTEQELGNWNGAGADPTEQELGNWNGAGADPTEQELGNWNGAGADPTEQELGNWNGELENWNGVGADPTEQELGNLNGAGADPTEQELGNLNGAGVDPTEDLAKRVKSGTNPGDLVKKVDSDTNPGDLAERVDSGTNPGIWPRSSVRVVSSPGSGETSRCDPEVSSSGASSGPPSPVNARVLRDLEVMKSDHDQDTAVIEGSLVVIRERYSILIEYGLHVPQPGQRPYSLDAPDMCISVDALEVGLWFPLHPLIEECLRWWRISLSQVAPNSWRYLIVFLGERQGAGIIPTRDLFMACFRLYKSQGGYYLTARVGFRVSGAPSNNKDQMDLGELRGIPKVASGKVPPTRPTAREVATPLEEPEVPAESEEGGASPAHQRPRSMKDLFKTKVHKGDAGYYALLMSDLGHHDPKKEIKAKWKGLKNSTKVWNNSSTAEEFERGLLHPQLAWELYMLPSEVLMARATKEMVLSQHFKMALFDRVHDASRLITFMDYWIKQLQEELDALKSNGGPEAVAKVEERASKLQEELEKTKRERGEELLRREASEKELHEVQSHLGNAQRLMKEARVRSRKMDDELLQVVKALESAQAKLPRQSVVQYMDSLSFKEGLKRMGQMMTLYADESLTTITVTIRVFDLGSPPNVFVVQRPLLDLESRVSFSPRGVVAA